MNAFHWVLIDETKGAKTRDGSTLSSAVLQRIAEAVTTQINEEFSAEWAVKGSIRVGKNAKDIKPGEWVYAFVPTLPDAPTASAYHDIDKNAVPYALCAVTTCEDLYGPSGISVDTSHEILETAGDAGANLYANDNKGWLHALEMCDAVEVQTYPKKSVDGTVVQVSNWLMQAWFIPGAKGPYDYMTSASLPGAVSPPGALLTAPGHGGNYQIIAKAGGSKQIMARMDNAHIDGTRRKGAVPNWSSRAALRLRNMAEIS
jgi:hypothetical protein